MKPKPLPPAIEAAMRDMRDGIEYLIGEIQTLEANEDALKEKIRKLESQNEVK